MTVVRRVIYALYGAVILFCVLKFFIPPFFVSVNPQWVSAFGTIFAATVSASIALYSLSSSRRSNAAEKERKKDLFAYSLSGPLYEMKKDMERLRGIMFAPPTAFTPPDSISPDQLDGCFRINKLFDLEKISHFMEPSDQSVQNAIVLNFLVDNYNNDVMRCANPLPPPYKLAMSGMQNRFRARFIDIEKIISGMYDIVSKRISSGPKMLREVSTDIRMFSS